MILTLFTSNNCPKCVVAKNLLINLVDFINATSKDKVKLVLISTETVKGMAKALMYDVQTLPSLLVVEVNKSDKMYRDLTAILNWKNEYSKY